MSERFQAAALVAAPCYPNAVVWSDENLVAVASGHLVTILNPSTPFGPRGLITLTASKPFPIGVIQREDILSPCMLPISLTREIKPCARSISWSPIGFAPNGGCLLAVCTTEGRVKLYRMPFCEYSAEWIEVMDITETLYTYLVNFNFWETGNLSLRDAEEQHNEGQPDQSSADGWLISGFEKQYMRRKKQKVDEIGHGNQVDKNVNDLICVPDHKGKHLKRKSGKVPESCIIPLITAEQYTSRSSMLSALVVAWSPILRLTSVVEETSPSNLFGGCSVLAVGMKSGRISFWRVLEPQCYSSMDGRDSVAVSLIGFLQPHDFWVTAVSWGLHESDVSNPQLLLATGSSNGSVKIWQAYGKELIDPSKIDHAPLSLLKEVVTTDSSPISVLSLLVPEKSQGIMLLAIGKGSGSVEVWIGNLRTSKFDKSGSFNAHEHIVTGLAWAFGGRCLYSCGQDDSMHSWILHENSLNEVPIPSNTPGLRSSFDVPIVYDSCFGIAVSPGNLAVAVAHCFDTHLLNPMYQERSQKAAVVFLWIGGQQLDLIWDIYPDFDIEDFPGLAEKELMSWDNNIIWSLNQYHNVEKPLVLWDVVAALSAFKQSAPKYLDHILLKWMTSLFRSQFDVLSARSSEIFKFLSSLTTRQLHILNLIGRHVVLKGLSSNHTDSKGKDFQELNVTEEQNIVWSFMLQYSEKELRERLLYTNFSGAISLASFSSTDLSKHGCWTPVGFGQMMKWVEINMDDMKDHLKLLAREVGEFKKRQFSSICKHITEDRCSFCSASVPFESAEVAFCNGVKNDDGVGQRHKLARCAVSMMVCPITPPWFCKSCKRWASHLAPPSLFSMSKYPSDLNAPESSFCGKPIKPFCPFCGILMQRLQPEFLLSPSPV
ncbi:hypothetical protein M9H77_26326 [Catharanthus roseus]|uniref:Uncharacterized protein n=1 Tax=Catharanthus roseus TaxID=4058 RepID=A0ACC0ADL6_CATRO|nr:hypothetical protein M9H77_26326 [Catharanthus roseus]